MSEENLQDEIKKLMKGEMAAMKKYLVHGVPFVIIPAFTHRHHLDLIEYRDNLIQGYVKEHNKNSTSKEF